jgi:hypothetical protein
MQNSVDHYFNLLDEPHRSCLLFLRRFILDFSANIEERRKNNTPFYYYKGKWLCFISYHPIKKDIYISFVDGAKIDHKELLSEGRKKMKIWKVDPGSDINIKTLKTIFAKAIDVQRVQEFRRDTDYTN